MTYMGFCKWADVLWAAHCGDRLYYQAPLDARPVRVHVARIFKNGKLRIAKPSRDADAFTADAAHLDRFLTESDIL
jgi:hypothetical protein